MREAEVEERVRGYLASLGYKLDARSGVHGVDILATRDGRRMAVEVKGDRPGHESSPGTIHVDVYTLLGQLIVRKGQRIADDYSIAIRPVHRRLIELGLPCLRELAVGVLLVDDVGAILTLDKPVGP